MESITNKQLRAYVASDFVPLPVADACRQLIDGMTDGQRQTLGLRIRPTFHFHWLPREAVQAVLYARECRWIGPIAIVPETELAGAR